MPCDCANLSPYQRLASAWNEVMNMRADLSEPNFAAATQILIDMDALMMRLEKEDASTPVPLYTSLCNHPHPPVG